MKQHLEISEVMRLAEKPDLKLFTLRDSKLFHVRTSQADPPGLRFDRYVTNTYDTIKLSEVAEGVASFNKLDAHEKTKPSRYAGKHRSASYLAAFLIHCASAQPKALPSNERNIPEASGQGYGLTPAQRKAVEDRGMECASDHYREFGWTVESRGKPFDLLCTKPTGEMHYVEVKASTGRLAEILVTNGEINFACTHPGKVDLFLLENVRLKGNRASGGVPSAFLWKCDRSRATPTHCRYRLDRKK